MSRKPAKVSENSWRYERPHRRTMNLDTAILISCLKDKELYTIPDMAATMTQRGTRRHRNMSGRLKSFITNHAISPDQGASRWYGANIKTHLSLQSTHRASLALRLMTVFSHLTEQRNNKEKLPLSGIFRIVGLRMRGPYRFSFVAGILVTALFLLSAGGAITAFFHQPSVFQVLEKEGMVAAFESLKDTPPKRAKSFQKAWIAFQDDNFTKARFLIFEILNSQPSEELIARCYYILGAIDLATGNPSGALQNFTLSYSLFDQENQHAMLHQTAISIAKAYIFLNMLDKAEEMFSHAWRHYEDNLITDGTEIHLATYYMELSHLNVRQNRFEIALNSARAGVKAAELAGAKGDIANTWSNLGLIYLMMGNLQEGLIYSNRAQLFLFDSDESRPAIINQINFVLLQRYEGKIDEMLLENINRWLSSHHDYGLQVKLDLVLTKSLDEFKGTGQ